MNKLPLISLLTLSCLSSCSTTTNIPGKETLANMYAIVRKVSGFNSPSKINEPAFIAAVDDIAAASRKLLHSLKTTALPRTRDKEIAKARARSARRFRP